MHSTYFSLGKNTFLKVHAELLFKKTPKDNNKERLKSCAVTQRIKVVEQDYFLTYSFNNIKIYFRFYTEFLKETCKHENWLYCCHGSSEQTYRAFGSEHIFSLFHCNVGYYILNLNVNTVYLRAWDVGEKLQVEGLTGSVDKTHNKVCATNFLLTCAVNTPSCFCTDKVRLHMWYL